EEAKAFDEPQISPDGRRVAYVFDGGLWVRDLDRLEPRRLESTEGAVAPFWSPDGRQLAFFAGTELWRIPVDGGRRELVCSLQGSLAGGRGGHGGHWGPDGTILFSRGNSGILAAPAVGGDAREIVAVDDSTEGDLHEPWRLPDGGILLVVHPLSATPGRLVVQHGAERTVLLDLPGHRILDPRYVDTGHILYERTGPNNNGLWAVPYAVADRALAGEPVLIVPEGAEGSVSADGQLVYANSQLGGEEIIAALGTDGTMIEAVTPAYTALGAPRLSPDGRRLAFSASDGEEVDVWVQDLRRGTRSRLTNPGPDFLQGWHPDGERLVFANIGSDRLLMRTLDNAAAPVELAAGREGALTPDGRHLLVTRPSADSRSDIHVVDLEAGGEARPLVAGPGAEDSPRVSPAGRHFLYVSNETGRREVFLRDFPSGAHPVQVSTEGADQALWSADGARIFLLSGEGMSEVTVAADARGGLELGRPRQLFVLGESGLLPDRGFEHDGTSDRFIMARRATPGADTSRPRLVLVQNWTRLLQAP
ncbi:MAG: PD40 domain-containing protein, partial [Krumholzibacteria bacterium]|nr:PD40 domain-containing protein [Candidatus Krumholzibacteria bacterium]